MESTNHYPTYIIIVVEAAAAKIIKVIGCCCIMVIVWHWLLLIIIDLFGVKRRSNVLAVTLPGAHFGLDRLEASSALLELGCV